MRHSAAFTTHRWPLVADGTGDFHISMQITITAAPPSYCSSACCLALANRLAPSAHLSSAMRILLFSATMPRPLPSSGSCLFARIYSLSVALQDPEVFNPNSPSPSLSPSSPGRAPPSRWPERKEEASQIHYLPRKFDGLPVKIPEDDSDGDWSFPSHREKDDSDGDWSFSSDGTGKKRQLRTTWLAQQRPSSPKWSPLQLRSLTPAHQRA